MYYTDLEACAPKSSGQARTELCACALGCAFGLLAAFAAHNFGTFGFIHAPHAATITTRPTILPSVPLYSHRNQQSVYAGRSLSTTDIAISPKRAEGPLFTSSQVTSHWLMGCATIATAALVIAMYLQRHLQPERCAIAAVSSSRGEWATSTRLSPLQAAASSTSLPVAEVGKFSIMGSVRKQNEDRFDFGPAGNATFFGVYDGHGGNGVSTWLQAELRERVARTFDPSRAEKSINRAFLAADKVICQPAKLFLGLPGERGIGGSKCGSTAAIALVYETDGVRKLAVANVGDARCLLIKKDGQVEQLTIDHVPDLEDERLRIESKNPNPRMPLVRFVGETWRVGGLLALSRAFGDAYLKSSGQFEGVSFNNSEYESGFGVIAEPDLTVIDLQPDDAYILLSSDGLYANTERGGGGGFENPEVGTFVTKNAGKPLDTVAETLCREAQTRGSTDDITVVLCRL